MPEVSPLTKGVCAIMSEAINDQQENYGNPDVRIHTDSVPGVLRYLDDYVVYYTNHEDRNSKKSPWREALAGLKDDGTTTEATILNAPPLPLLISSTIQNVLLERVQQQLPPAQWPLLMDAFMHLAGRARKAQKGRVDATCAGQIFEGWSARIAQAILDGLPKLPNTPFHIDDDALAHVLRQLFRGLAVSEQLLTTATAVKNHMRTVLRASRAITDEHIDATSFIELPPNYETRFAQSGLIEFRGQSDWLSDLTKNLDQGLQSLPLWANKLHTSFTGHHVEACHFLAKKLFATGTPSAKVQAMGLLVENPRNVCSALEVAKTMGTDDLKTLEPTDQRRYLRHVRQAVESLLTDPGDD